MGTSETTSTTHKDERVVIDTQPRFLYKAKALRRAICILIIINFIINQLPYLFAIEIIHIMTIEK